MDDDPITKSIRNYIESGYTGGWICDRTDDCPIYERCKMYDPKGANHKGESCKCEHIPSAKWTENKNSIAIKVTHDIQSSNGDKDGLNNTSYEKVRQ